jgi:hypothetical protein
MQKKVLDQGWYAEFFLEINLALCLEENQEQDLEENCNVSACHP